jgi:hypothetical protein
VNRPPTPKAAQVFSIFDILNGVVRDHFGLDGIDPGEGATHDASATVAQVFDALSGEERNAVEAMYRLDGMEAVKHWLNDRFRTPEDDPTDVGTFVPFRYVRINPRSRKLSHGTHGVTIKREAGWHRVSRGMARLLAQEPENDMHPEDSPCIFEITAKRPTSGRVAELNV